MKNAIITTLLAGAMCAAASAQELKPLKYNNPGLVVDLGVGLWNIPMPMDYDRDGDNDLVIVCTGKPKNGIYFFENTEGKVKMPVFKPGVRIDKAMQNFQLSYVNGEPRVLRTGEEFLDFRDSALAKRVKLPVDPEVHKTTGRIRANQWRYLDYDGDGAHDLIVGIEDWTDYGWDDTFDKNGNWTNGPLHGVIYMLRNTGTDNAPVYASPVRVEADGKPIDGFGMPSPSFADFDGDGDLDLICGEFVDKMSYFENVGTRKEPKYSARGFIQHNGAPITMESCMINPIAFDWDGDGDPDLVVGQEDGRVALIENTGKSSSGQPIFTEPVFFKQVADEVKCGVLVNPVAFDWDGDGDQDILCGDAAGYISVIENLDGAAQPKFAAPKALEAGGKMIRIQAGKNGSIQGPAEAKWGYTTIGVGDWDGDGLPDIVANSIWGKVHWYKNIGSRTSPKLAEAQPIEVAYTGAPTKPEWVWYSPGGNELITQWRTTPMVVDATNDGLLDLVMLDRDGYLSLFERRKNGDKLELLPPKHVFRAADGDESVREHNSKAVKFDLNNDGVNDLALPDANGKLNFFTMSPMGNRENVMTKSAQRAGDPVFADSDGNLPLRLTGGWGGRSGRRKLSVVDYNGDGKLDLLLNSTNVNLLENIAEKPGQFVFKDKGPLDTAELAGHDTAPSTADFDRNGIPDLLVGAEDGFIYHMKNPRATGGK